MNYFIYWYLVGLVYTFAYESTSLIYFYFASRWEMERVAKDDPSVEFAASMVLHILSSRNMVIMKFVIGVIPKTLFWPLFFIRKIRQFI